MTPSARPRGMIVTLCSGIVARHQQVDQRVAALVIGGGELLLLGHDHRAPLRAHHHLVLGVLEFLLRDQALVAPRGQQSRLVDEVGQVGAGEARRAARDHPGVDVGRQRHLAHVHFQDLLAAAHVRVRHHDLPVEAAGAQQRGVEHVGAVGGRDDDDALVGLEAVHLDQQLIQRLLALVVAATEAGAAVPADGVDLVDEDDAGGILLGLLEHVAHARGADADEHLHEVGARDGEERHVRLAGDGARDQRLAGAGGADQQRAARDAAAEPLELLRIAQELDDLLQVGLGLVHARHVLERDTAVTLGQQLGLGFAEAHGAAAARLHLAHEEDPHADQQQHREPVDQHAQDGGHVLLGGPRRDLDALLAQPLDEVGILGRNRGEGAALVAVGAGNAVLGDGYFRHVAGLDAGQELRIADLVAAPALAGILEEVEKRHQQQADDDPDREVPEIGIHRGSFMPWGVFRGGSCVPPGPRHLPRRAAARRGPLQL